MLVVHSASTCDVCLEGYDSSSKTPHAILCGHVFCLSCLQSLSRRQCPLCRAPFEVSEVRRIHIDRSSVQESINAPVVISISDADGENVKAPVVRHYQAAITRIVREGDSMSTVRGMLDEVRAWLKTQPEDEHVDLRATFLLFYRYMDFQAKNKALEQDIARMKEEVKVAETACEDLRAQAQTEREAAEAKYARLVHTSREERLRATAMEKSKRDHAEKMEREWREKHQESVLECARLKALVADLTRNPLPPPPEPVDDHLYLTDDSTSSSDDNTRSEYHESPEPRLVRLATDLPRALGDDMFRLSPIPPTPVVDEDLFEALKPEDGTERKPTLLNFASPMITMSPAPARKSALTDKGTSSPHISRSLPRGYESPMKNRSRSNSVQEASNSRYPPSRTAASAYPSPPSTADVSHESLRGQLYDLLDQRPGAQVYCTPSGGSSRGTLPRVRSTQVLSSSSTQTSPLIRPIRPETRRRNTTATSADAFISYPTPPTPPPPPPMKVHTLDRPPVLSTASGAALAAEQRMKGVGASGNGHSTSSRSGGSNSYLREVYPPPQPQSPNLQRRSSGGSTKGKGRPSKPDLWAAAL